jgi:hypothetical protein
VTEPSEIADEIADVVEGVWHWRIRNSNIGGAISSSHAVSADGGCVLIDPVRLSEEALAALPPPEAILLNATCHQRSAWRYREQLFSVGGSLLLDEASETPTDGPGRARVEADHRVILAMSLTNPTFPEASRVDSPGRPGA